MKHLLTAYEMTKEARSAAESYFRSLRTEAEKSAVSTRDIDELSDSLEEHLGFALRQELDKKRLNIVDAQLMMELLLALGSPEELSAELSRETGKEKSPAKAGPTVTQADSLPPIPPTSATSSVPPIPPIPPIPPGSPSASIPDWRSRFWRKPLCRSSRDRWIFGVCGGFAEFFGVSSSLLRLLCVLSGIGIVAYLILGLMLPREEELIPGQATPGISGCLIRGLEFTFMAAMLLFVYLPVAFGMMFLTLMGFSKIMFELGFSGPPTGDSWSFFVIGVPGLLSGLCNLVLGLSFLAVTIHFAMSSLSNRAVLSLNTRKVLVFAALLSLLIQGGLCAWSVNLNRMEFSDKETTIYQASDVRQIVLETGNKPLPLHRYDIDILGDSTIGSISVEIVRQVTGRDSDQAGETLRYVNASSVLKDGQLVLSADVPLHAWWFYRYPSVKTIIRVPIDHPVSLVTRGKMKRGNLKLRDLRGPITLDSGIIDVNLEQIKNSLIKIDAQMGSIDLRNIETATCSLHTNLGSIDGRDLICNAGEMETNMGSIKLNRVKGNLQISTDMGSIEVLHFSGATFRARTNAGSIELGCEQLSSGSDIRLESDMGSIIARLPETPIPLLNLDTTMGHIENRFRDSMPEPNAPKVTAKTQMGRISIKRQKPAMNFKPAKSINSAASFPATPTSRLPAEAIILPTASQTVASGSPTH